MKAIGIIPARWGSTRFEGKVLAKIKGQPLIWHVWQRCCQSEQLDDVIIACDQENVLKAAEAFGAKAVLTRKDHDTGTDRIIEVAKDLEADIVVNIQGDEPLMHCSVIDGIVDLLSNDQEAVVSTAIKVIDKPEEIDDHHVVKVVIDHNNHALYFSRAPIPFNRNLDKVTYYKHLGIYAYRREFLFKFKDLPESRLESAERLEQLRVLESGYKIKTFLTSVETIGVDVPADIQKVEDLLETLN